MQNLSSVIRILSYEPNTDITAWLYNQNNQLLDSVDNQFTYDANGNQVEEQDSSGQLQKQYIYNTENRLSEIKDENGQTIASYYYDPFARRLSKTITDTSSSSVTTTYFHYNDEGYSAEKTDGQIISYLFSPQQTWSTSPILKRENNTYYYYQNDHLGTPNILHDKQGQVVNAREMKAFGQWTNSTSVINDNFAFAGQYKDAETGTYYNFHRDYNPNVGRYIESDPIGLGGGKNLYYYVHNSPINAIDPNGEVAWFIAPLIGSLVGSGIDLTWQLYINKWDLKCVDPSQVLLSGLMGAIMASTGPSSLLFGRAGRTAVNHGSNNGSNTKDSHL